MVKNRHFNIYIITFLILGVITSCSDSNNDWSKEGLKGKVASYTEINDLAKNNSGEWVVNSESVNYEKVEFDKDGVSKGSSFYFDNNLAGSRRFEKKDGKTIKEFFYIGDGELFSIIDYSYLPGDKVEIITSSGNGVVDAIATEYYKNNQIVMSEHRDGVDKSKIKFTMNYEYDKNHNVVKSKFIDLETNEIYISEFEYLSFDDKGNWTKRIEYPSELRSNENTYITIREFEYY